MARLVSLPYMVDARMCSKAAVRGRILLVVTTSPHLAGLRETMLRKRYAVTTVEGFEAICRQAAGGAVDVILLDLTGDVDAGLALCRALRTAGVTDTILMLHPAGTVDDMLAGFDAGADVYLRGPRGQADLLGQLGILCRTPVNSRWKRMFGL